LKQISSLLQTHKHYFAVSLIFLAFIISFLPKDTVKEGQIAGVSTIQFRGQEMATPSLPIALPMLGPDIPAVQAQSYFVYHEETGSLIGERNIHTQLPIASLTKLLTFLVSVDILSPGDTVNVFEKDLVDIKPVTGVREGDQVLVNDLIASMLIGSANDAAGLLAAAVEGKTGQRFEDLLNQKAAKLGMTESHFSNPQGFDAVDNFSTAFDLSLLVKASTKHGVFETLGRSKDYSFTSLSGEPFKVKATNRLIRNHADIEAIKTGNTPEAKGGMITRVSKEGQYFIIIVLGSLDRETDTLLLKDALFAAHTINK
jgi:serine-type D-Ala-D-Ala carboxypeptidase (penicillin-binding protein 5/6)